MKKAFLVFAVCVAGSAAWATVGGGDISFKVDGASNVVYSHDDHVTKAKLKCTDCHYKIFNTKSPVKWTMADMQKGKSCGTCHNGTRAFDIKNCSQCHK